jgi:RNA polymerase sigma factor (sigma-70 family)
MKTDEQLVAACIEGDDAAWSALIDRYKNLVYSVPFKYRMPREDAADIFQAVWVDLYTELKNLRNAGAIRGWLLTVATHKCYQWKRRREMADPVAAATHDMLPDSRPLFPQWKVELEREQMLRDALEKMPDRCRLMVEMLFFKSPPLPYAEVARQLGLAEGSIGFIRGRCLGKLRKTLEEMGF